MYRLMIADDEALEREGLEMMIKRTMPDQFEFIHAENGRIAIQKAEDDRPDIVFMDIRMPGIQGLEALREIRSILPNVKMVLVTAYDYFAYAQEAVQLGVKDYILKPAKKEQIVETLMKLMDELKEERKRRRETLETKEKVSQLLPVVENELALMLMMDSIQSTAFENLADFLEFRFLQGYALVCRFEWREKDSSATITEKKRGVYDAVRNKAKSNLTCLVSPIIESQMALFVVGDDKKHAYWHHVQAIEWGNQFNQFIEHSFEVSVSVGIGTVRSGWEGLRQSYQEALLSAGEDSAQGPVRHWEDIKQLKPTAKSFTLEAERTIMTESAVRRAQTMIEEHYQEDLTMEYIAERVNLSPYYFSKIFKAQAGENFIDYLTKLRTNRAKELMKDNQLSLKEICYSVGYKDPNYFSRVFKKVVGLTPSEYRQNN